jgi:septum formation protein
MKPFWRGEQPLVLASRSEVRSSVLRSAAIPHIVRPADIDERAVERSAPVRSALGAAQLLARTKALAVLADDALVLGADQTLALGDRRFSKPGNRDAAREQLRALRGHTHELHCAIALTQSGKVVFEHAESARLTMRAFTDEFLEMYLDQLGAKITRTVGAYQVEKTGIQLFERIDGDHFVILGLPLLPLLHFLRRQKLVVA